MLPRRPQDRPLHRYRSVRRPGLAAAPDARSPAPFTEAERDKIVQAFKDKSRFYYPFVYLLFWTGVRPSEALALRWEDIDYEARLPVNFEVALHGRQRTAPRPPGSEREIRLLPDVVEVFKCG